MTAPQTASVPPPPPLGDGTDAPLLTERERAAVTAMAIGLTQTVASRRYETSPRTFRRLLVSAERRLGANGLVNTVALAVARGLIDRTHLQERTIPEMPPASRPNNNAPPTHRRLSHDVLTEIAAVYQANPGRTTKAIAERFGLPLSTAGSRIKIAREAGLIATAAPRGRRNEAR